MPRHDVKSIALIGTVTYQYFPSGASVNSEFFGIFDTSKFPNGVSFYTTTYWNSATEAVTTRVLQILQSDSLSGPFSAVPMKYLNGTYEGSSNTYPYVSAAPQVVPLAYNSIGIYSNKRYLRVNCIIVNSVTADVSVSIEMVGGVRVLPVDPQQINATY